jgi:hypothetical protein
VKQDLKRNITFSLPADLINQAKMLAVKRESSVNAIVTDLLRKELEAGADEHVAAMEQFLARAKQIKVKLPKERWTRDSLYDV